MSDAGAPRGQGAQPMSSRAAYSAGGPRSAGAPARGAEWDSLLDFNADPFALYHSEAAPGAGYLEPLRAAGADAGGGGRAPAAELPAWEEDGLDLHDMLFGHRPGTSPSESYEEPFSGAAAARSGPYARGPNFALPSDGSAQLRAQPNPRAGSSGAWMCPDNLFLSDMSSGLSAPRRSGASGAMPYHFAAGGVSDAAANRAWLGSEFGVGAVPMPPGARAAVKHEAAPRARAAGAGGAKAGTPKRKASAAAAPRHGAVASPAAPDGAPPRTRPHLKVKMPLQPPQPAAFAAPAAAAGAPAAAPVVVRTKPRSVIAGRGPQPPLRLSVLTGAQGALHGGGARAGAAAAAPAAAPLPLLADAPPRAEAPEARAPPPPVDEGRALADLQGAVKNVDFAMRESIRDSLLRMSRSFAERAAARAAGAPAAQLPAFAAAAGAAADGGDSKTAKWLEAVDNGVGTLLYHPYWEDDNAERAANMPMHAMQPLAAAGGVA